MGHRHISMYYSGLTGCEHCRCGAERSVDADDADESGMAKGRWVQPIHPPAGPAFPLLMHYRRAAQICQQIDPQATCWGLRECRYGDRYVVATPELEHLVREFLQSSATKNTR